MVRPWDGSVNWFEEAEELETRLEDLIGELIRDGDGNQFAQSNNVGRAQRVKYMVGELLGYDISNAGLRTKIWKDIKPITYLPHRLSVFSMCWNNWQPWTYQIPSDSDDLVAIILYDNDDDSIRDVIVETAETCLSWDTTGTRTTKHQATILTQTRLDANATVLDYCGIPQIVDVLQPLIGSEISNSDNRRRGEELCTLISEQNNTEWEENGQFPDITFPRLGVNLECKVQDSNVIDLGQFHPEDTNVAGNANCSPSETIYCIACVSSNIITGFILSYGRDLVTNGISIIESQAYKLQIRMPNHLFTRSD